MMSINDTIGCVNHDCDKCKAQLAVPLTDGQREEIAKGWRGRNWTVGDIIDATEAAHKITKGGAA